MPIIDLPISDLARDSIERSRPLLDPDRVAHYLQHLDESTPVVVFNVGGLLLLADGHHRVAAAEQLGRSTVRADVREGQRSDALQFRPNSRPLPGSPSRSTMTNDDWDGS
jgi:ParB-like chromosome segregation protein Spo0J